MEALRNLEQVQRTLSLLQSHDLSSNHRHDENDDSDRFLANFLMFMVKPCGTLDLRQKYDLISENLPKISPGILEEAMVSLNEEDKQYSGEHFTDCCLDSKSDVGSIGTDTDMPMIGLDAMQRANSTLEDFFRSYFMFHEMDVNRPESVFRYLPILSFAESYIYQLDSLNEEISNISAKIAIGNTAKERNQRLTDNFVEAFKTILIEDVMRAIHLKSFDYRVLSLLLYKLRETQVNEMHMEFLSISEFLVEVSDDLFDYEDDVIDNNFNILRMFVGVYGASMASVMLAKYITDAEEKYEYLSKSLDPELFLNYRRRCEEATKEGGNRAGHSLGTWSIPSVIADEEFYRSERLSSNLMISSVD
ncbi:Atp synthase subunit b [Thalictrum thalictroides]|uniref:Atp synthase subunit b n=1 Tax=Thalictrum thalictroides TaxID=46969 RepID=A0A7J6W735_THATH|nr:Atp synthase subunit b [Thalictrum thalictroides]